MDEKTQDPEPAERLDALIARNRALPLGRYIRSLARASAMASGIAAAGCGGSEAGAWIDPANAIMPICEASGEPGSYPRWRPTRGLNPSLEYDYLAVFTTPLPPSGQWLYDWDGEPCSATSDPDRCEMLIEADPYGINRRLTIRTGETVRHFDDKDEYLRFLGEVDTAQEALLLAFLQHNEVECLDAALGSARRVSDGFEVVVSRVTASCDPIEFSRVLIHVASDGTMRELRSEVYETILGTCIGRRPEGLARHAPSDVEAGIGTRFAKIATLEAAAVLAFERLGKELEGLGAPPDLLAEIERARRDEARHTDVMTRVARQFGVEPAEPSVVPVGSRSAHDIALENAVEGCIRETFGALTGCYQSLAATNPVLAEAMRQVSEDEVFHAELSGRVDAFLDTLLSEPERESVTAAKRRAVGELRLETRIQPEDDLATLAGLPPRNLALQWIDRLERDVWNTGRSC